MKKLLAFVLFATTKFMLAQNVIITNVNIIPIEGGEAILKNQTVTIKEGTITDISPYKKALVAVPKNTTLINGAGKYLMPGLADMHVHFPNEKEMPLQQFFNLNLAAGVTTLRSMRGEPRHLLLRDSINKKLIVAPDLYISSALPNDSSVTDKDLEKFIKKSKQEGWDFIKYLSGLTTSLFYNSALISKESGIKLAGHVYNQDLQTAIQANQASVEHYQAILKEYKKDTLHFDGVIKQLKDKNIFVCPTLSFYYIWTMQYTANELNARNGINNLSAELLAKWQKDYADYVAGYNTPEKISKRDQIIINSKNGFNQFDKILKRLNDEGVKLLLSPDESAYNVPGFAMVEEMKLYKKAGLSNYAILKIATYNAAGFFDKQNEWGSVTKSKKANLILLDKNPLDDIENIKSINTVILGGKEFKPEVLLKK